MSYPKLNSENNEIKGNLIVEPEFKILPELKKIQFKINTFKVEKNQVIEDLIERGKIKLGFTLECDSTFLKSSGLHGDKISWSFDDIGGKVKSTYFLICVEPFAIEPSPEIIDSFYETRINFKKNYLVSPMITDVYNINKLNIGSSVDFLRIKHQPTLRKGSYAFWDDDSVVKLLIKDSETYILAKKMLRKKNTSSLVRQLLFIPYFLEILNDLSEGAENEREWFEDFKNMLGYDGDELVDFDERFNFLINALGNKRENFDGLKASLKSLEKIRNN